jgi:hypothetical protein
MVKFKTIIIFLMLQFGFGSIMTFAFDYPIKRGTEEWNRLTPEERKAFSQIPPEILSQIPTDELIQAYLDYPFLITIMFYDNLQTGFDVLKNQFNGARELLRRKNAGSELLRFYKKMDASKIEQNRDLLTKGKFSVEFINVEILLAQEEILKQLSRSERMELISESIKNYEIKKENSDIHGVFGQAMTALPLGRLLQILSRKAEMQFAQEPELRHFLASGQLKNATILSEIVEIAREQ